MANGIVIHVAAGNEKRTEFFINERVRIGTDAVCELRIQPPDSHRLAATNGVWLELVRGINGNYRIVSFDEALDLRLNHQPLVLQTRLKDGDTIALDDEDSELSLVFFSVPSNASITASRAREARVAPFIETAAIESAATSNRDDAKIFLKEFTRELVREISWVTKLVVLLIVVGTLGGLFYLGTGFYKEMKRNREQAAAQSELIKQLQTQLSRTSSELGNLDKSNKQIIGIVSLAPTLRNEYGNGVCLLVGTYDLVDKASGKQLRYPDPTVAATPDPFEPQPAPQISESGENFTPNAAAQTQQQQESPLTTEGGGTAVEFDFVGTGFHVGSGFLLTNRHVVQPWANDERVKVLAQLSNGRARLRRLVVYFPGFPNPFPVRVRDVGTREDLAIASIDPNSVFPEIPVLPLDANSDAVSIGRTVVTMGYPNGPDRILAMVDESEARSIQARYGSNLQTLVNFLAQTKRIQPLTTQGTITDLQERRIVHDAKTAEGGSGAPLFGQSGRVIGVNFGVFTENTAGNMAIPIKYAVGMLERAGWRSPEQKQALEVEKAEKPANNNASARLSNNSSAAANNSQR